MHLISRKYPNPPTLGCCKFVDCIVDQDWDQHLNVFSHLQFQPVYLGFPDFLWYRKAKGCGGKLSGKVATMLLGRCRSASNRETSSWPLIGQRSSRSGPGRCHTIILSYYLWLAVRHNPGQLPLFWPVIGQFLDISDCAQRATFTHQNISAAHFTDISDQSQTWCKFIPSSYKNVNNF